MEWEFSPEQVVKAEVAYAFDDFRADLLRETRINTGMGDPEQLRATYDLLFDLCYWLATGRPFEGFLAEFRHTPPAVEFLHGVVDAMRPNADMLGAILQRMIMDRVEHGMPLESALAAVHEEVSGLCARPV
jgi:hypothetical protein